MNIATMEKALTKEAVLKILADELPYLRQRYGVVRIALYGSFAHGSPTRKSDVDLLVKLLSTQRRDSDYLADIREAMRRIIAYTTQQGD